MKNNNLMKKIVDLLNDSILCVILCISMFLFTVLFSLLKLPNMSVVFGIIGSVFLLFNVKKIVCNYMSISFLFTAFHTLYGLAGPISVVWFDGLTSTYGSEYNIFPYMIAYSLASIFYCIGFYFCSKKKNIKNDNDYHDIISLKKSKLNNYRNYFLFIAQCGFFLVFVFELINFLRAGGISTVIRGKAIYQAAVDELRFTLPTIQLSQVSIASLSVYLFISFNKNQSISKKGILFTCLFFLPYLALLIFLARRGIILTYIIMFCLGFYQYKPMQKITKKAILIVVLLYFSLGLMFAARNNTKLIFSDFKSFITKTFSKNNLITAFNPGKNEFGCTFGNFNRLYIRNDYNFLYGKSYIQGITHIVPSYFYVGEKPKLLMYEFRDKYFPRKAEISSIAGTAFSSILEAFWNFWYFGMIVYAIYGYIICSIELKYKKKNMFNLMKYFVFAPFIYEFHRSDFGHISYEIILCLLMILVIQFFYKFFCTKKGLISQLINQITRFSIGNNYEK